MRKTKKKGYIILHYNFTCETVKVNVNPENSRPWWRDIWRDMLTCIQIEIVNLMAVSWRETANTTIRQNEKGQFYCVMHPSIHPHFFYLLSLSLSHSHTLPLQSLLIHFCFFNSKTKYYGTERRYIKLVARFITLQPILIFTI
jgi:hypothetical protein